MAVAAAAAEAAVAAAATEVSPVFLFSDHFHPQNSTLAAEGDEKDGGRGGDEGRRGRHH